MKLNLFDFRDIKKFIDFSSSSLVAYSIFLTTIMMIFEADYVQQDNVFHKVTVFLLFFIILFLGFFIFANSNKYENFFVRTFGLIVLAFPMFFISFLADNLEKNILEGGYTLVLLLSIVLSTSLTNLLLKYLQTKYFKNSWCYASLCLFLAVIFFLVIKYTSFVTIISTNIFSLFRISIMPDLIQIIFSGIFIGFFVGLVLAPSFVVIRKIFPKTNSL
jgi:hypothetical protein